MALVPTQVVASRQVVSVNNNNSPTLASAVRRLEVDFPSEGVLLLAPQVALEPGLLPLEVALGEALEQRPRALGPSPRLGSGSSSSLRPVASGRPRQPSQVACLGPLRPQAALVRSLLGLLEQEVCLALSRARLSLPQVASAVV